MRPLTALLIVTICGCAERRSGPLPLPRGGRAAGAGSALEEVSFDAFTYIGPGSMGRFVDYRIHPTHEDAIVAVADVGGVYLSADGGESWDNVGRDLPTNGVWGVDFAVEQGEGETTRIVLGTDSGIFYSDDLDTSAGLDPGALTTWTEVDGIEIGDERPDTTALLVLASIHRNRNTLPIGVVTVDPGDPDLVWAGITAMGQMNLAQNAKDPVSNQHFDKWKVYRSTDGGRSFEPALRFSEPVPAFAAAGFDSDGSVFSILVDPDDSGRVLVASDRGLYASEDADTTEDADGDGLSDITWAEIGAEARRVSADLGLSWSDTAAGCEPWSEDSEAAAWCLPVIDSAPVEFVLDPETGWPELGFETHPNLRSLSLSRVDGVERLYVTVWDRGHAGDAPEGCSTGALGDGFVDSGLEFYRGGVYVSEDGGERWAWLLTDNGAPGLDPEATPLIEDIHYRCDVEASERNSDDLISFFPDVEAPAEATGGDLLVVAALGYGSGLWVYDADAIDPWTYLTDPEDADFLDRFEGGQPLNLSIGDSVEASKLLVDWDTATDGYPDVYFGARGVLHGTWSAEEGTYTFDHLGSVYGGEVDGLGSWSGTGLDDAVVWDVLEVGDALYVGVSDGTLLRGAWDGERWYYVSLGQNTWTTNWSDVPDEMRKDETHAIAYDAEAGVLYASNVVSAVGHLYSVLADDGAGWRVIGGYGYTSDPDMATTLNGETYNGLFSGSPLARLDVHDLLAVPASEGVGIELIVATGRGLWSYSSERAAGAQWERLCGELTDGFSWREVNADLSLAPGVAFAVSDTRRAGGLLAIELAGETCESIRVRSLTEDGSTTTGRDPIRNPSAVALAEADDGAARLVVGASYQSYVGLFSGPLDCAETCTVTGWTRAFNAEGVYEATDPRDEMMSRFDVTAIAVDPTDKRVVLASLGATPGYDYYNPQYVLASEDGGETVDLIDFEAEDHGLPNRSMHQLEFSDDGDTLYAATRSSLFWTQVGW